MTQGPDLPPADASDAEIELFTKGSAAVRCLEIAPGSLEPVKANILILLQHASRFMRFPPETGAEAPGGSRDGSKT